MVVVRKGKGRQSVTMRGWLAAVQGLRFNYLCPSCSRNLVHAASKSASKVHDGRSLVQGGDDGGGDAQTLSTRNVGIMAHIDAGKTTTTERLLFYAGFIRRMGDVDDGNTVMDYLAQERERGITINSAAISFHWLNHRINLIDTPGHVDFTFEVERSLRVLDGAVTLLDGSAGVEAQTTTVWRQAEQYSIPRVAFVNKMDKPAASFMGTVSSMEKKLRATPLVVQLPLGQGRNFTGVMDLLTMDVLTWAKGGDGRNFTRVPLITHTSEDGKKDFKRLSSKQLIDTLNAENLPLDSKLVSEALDMRYNLAEQVVTLDSQLEEVLADQDFDPISLQDDLLKAGIRRLTISCSATPVLCGSSLKNVAVQPLMEAIIDYLPAPQERTIINVPEELKELYAYAFKVVHDARRGPLVFLRLYSGSIKPQSTVHNISRSVDERVTRVLLMLADEQREVSIMEEGNIAVAVGMKNTYTGDTIVQSSSCAKAALRAVEQQRRSTDDQQFRPAGAIPELGAINIPPPVFFCSVEPSSAAQQKDLDHALSCLSREDPSLRVSINQETGQTVLSGMGELHLEIIHDHLRRDFKVDCSLGKLQVAYREAPSLEVTRKEMLDRTVGGKRHSVAVEMSLTPLELNQDENTSVKVSLDVDRESIKAPGYSREELLSAIKSGVESACLQGPLLAFPVQNIRVAVTSLTLGSVTSLPVLSSCISECVSKALRESEVQLLEPCTNMVVMVPEEHLGVVLSDLTSQRRGQVKEVGSIQDSREITAITPLACLMGYSTALRTMTSGMGTFSATFSHYEPVSREIERTIIQQIRGYVW